ncbi:MAG: hypothetical protein ABWY36_01640 [Leifsonia sp.]
MKSPDEDQAVTEIIERLSARFPDAPHAYVESVVDSEHHVYDGRPVRTYVPVLVERGARQKLRTQTDTTS